MTLDIPIKAYKQAELARVIGASSAAISKAVKNGELIRTGKLIDLANTHNYNRIREMHRNAMEQKAEQPQKKLTTTTSAQNQLTPIRDNYPEHEAPQLDNVQFDDDIPTSKHALDIYQRKLTAQKTKEEVEKLRIQNAKANAEVIPTDLVQDVITRFNKNMITAFHNLAEQRISILAKKYKLSNADIASERGILIEQVNQASKEGIEISLKEVNVIADEYAAKRGVGQRN